MLVYLLITLTAFGGGSDSPHGSALLVKSVTQALAKVCEEPELWRV